MRSATLASAEVPLQELRPFHRNPRLGNVKAIVRSLRTLGQYRPIVVNRGTFTGRRMEILAGNHTFLAAKELGWETIVAVILDVDETVAKKIALVDNRLPDLGDYDHAVLDSLLRDLPDLEATGYEDYNLDELTSGVVSLPLMAEEPSLADFRPEPESQAVRLDRLSPQPCPSCGYDVANDPEGLRGRR